MSKHGGYPSRTVARSAFGELITSGSASDLKGRTCSGRGAMGDIDRIDVPERSLSSLRGVAKERARVWQLAGVGVVRVSISAPSRITASCTARLPLMTGGLSS